MRATLDIADDGLLAARSIALRDGKAIGQVLSELARKGLAASKIDPTVHSAEALAGFKPLPSRGVIGTSEIIERLDDEIP